MSRAVRVNATMDEELVRRVDAFASSRYEDRSTALRQLVDFALRELQKRDASVLRSGSTVTPSGRLRPRRGGAAQRRVAAPRKRARGPRGGMQVFANVTVIS